MLQMSVREKVMLSKEYHIMTAILGQLIFDVSAEFIYAHYLWYLTLRHCMLK